jgi:hypothetical protein
MGELSMFFLPNLPKKIFNPSDLKILATPQLYTAYIYTN